MSHTIDLKSHGTSKCWNGHWTYSDFEWSLIKAGRDHLLNREPYYSTHINIMKKLGFKILEDVKTTTKSEIQKKQLATRFKNFNDVDLTTSSVFIQSAK